MSFFIFPEEKPCVLVLDNIHIKRLFMVHLIKIIDVCWFCLSILKAVPTFQSAPEPCYHFSIQLKTMTPLLGSLKSLAPNFPEACPSTFWSTSKAYPPPHLPVRSYAYVISALFKRNEVDVSFYSASSLKKYMSIHSEITSHCSNFLVLRA